MRTYLDPDNLLASIKEARRRQARLREPCKHEDIYCYKLIERNNKYIKKEIEYGSNR